MLDAQSPEINIPQANKFDVQLRGRYGDGFLQSYRNSKVINTSGYDVKPPDFPYFSEAKPILENAQSLRFVEWKKDNGGIDWRYVVTTTEDRPVGGDKYICDKVFSYDPDNKRWIQETTHIESNKPLPMHERISKAVKGSLSSALQERLGLKFTTDYSQSGYVSEDKIAQLPFGEELKKLLPKGNVRIKYLEEPELIIPRVAKLGEESTLIEAYGSNFHQAYNQAKSYRTENLPEEVKSQLPQYDQLEKNIIKGEKDLPFKYVEWIEKEGKANFAYVFNWWSESEGKKQYYYQVVRPNTDKQGKADLISTNHSFIPSPLEEKPTGERKESCYVIEQEKDGQSLIQVLRPSVSVKGGFEDVFIGVVDNATKKCLVFNEIYPEVTFVQTSDKKRTLVYGAITVSTKPVCYLSRLDLSEQSSFAHQMLTGRLNPSVVIGHELGHNEDFQRVLQEGERAYQKYRPSLSELLYIMVLPSLVQNIIDTAPLVLTGNPTPFIVGSLVVAGNTIFGNAFLEKEVAADRNVKVLVQSARENGVELMNGLPDNKLPIITRMILIRITNEMYKIFTKPKLPLH